MEIAGWLGCLAFLIWIVNGGIGLTRSLKDKPAPADVQRESAEKFALKSEFTQHTEWNRREHENLFSKIGGADRAAEAACAKKHEELRAERREDMSNLYGEINEVGKKVASLEAINQLQNQRMAGMDAKLDRLIERKA